MRPSVFSHADGSYMNLDPNVPDACIPQKPDQFSTDIGIAAVGVERDVKSIKQGSPRRMEGDTV